jgi:hypothetical protein
MGLCGLFVDGLQARRKLIRDQIGDSPSNFGRRDRVLFEEGAIRILKEIHAWLNRWVYIGGDYVGFCRGQRKRKGESDHGRSIRRAACEWLPIGSWSRAQTVESLQ